MDINNYPAIKKHLDNYYPQLEKRLDKGVTPYHLRNCAYTDDFNRQKIIYSVINKAMNFCIDDKLIFVNDKCFVLNGENIYYLCAFLNSSLFKFCFKSSFPELGEAPELRKSVMDIIRVKKVSDDKEIQFKLLIEQISSFGNDSNLSKDIYKKIDDVIFDIYDLNDFEKQLIGSIETQ